MSADRVTWLPLAVGVVLAGTLLTGAGTVATAGLPTIVPAEIRHTVRVQVVVGGNVTVSTPDLDEFKPGQLLPDRLRVDGLPDRLTLDIPISVDGAVEGDHRVTCVGCAP